MRHNWTAPEFETAPPLDPHLQPRRVQPRLALLVNPFYRKDPRASFGKHVLTPSLALTSIAAATPAEWVVRLWDENLLQGPPPVEPVPEVVGITVHLTLALAGCTGVFIGFESLTDANLEAARKRTPSACDYARRVRVFHDNGIQVNASFVFGFDHDRPDVFDRTLRWIEEQRLECATFHILTPYPGTPLFRALETEGRLLHRDWSRYDTAHAVFRPRHMSPEELEAGYAACYDRLFSHHSIWRRRPQDARAVVPYLAMSYLYKRANRIWALLIRHRLTSRVWRPLVEITRWRHLRFRKRLSAAHQPCRAEAVLSAGV
jgi:hypothetical protein